MQLSPKYIFHNARTNLNWLFKDNMWQIVVQTLKFLVSHLIKVTKVLSCKRMTVVPLTGNEILSYVQEVHDFSI